MFYFINDKQPVLYNWLIENYTYLAQWIRICKEDPKSGSLEVLFEGCIARVPFWCLSAEIFCYTIEPYSTSNGTIVVVVLDM